jgi:hypothetical protein
MSQPKTNVVHCQKSKYDVYIGRSRNTDSHYGNPFSHLDDTLASVKVDTREEAVGAFRSWLSGTDYKEIEPSRREWILSNIPTLKGKTLGCWCLKGKACHGDVLKELADANN